jgi:hypothetical protein
MHRDASFFFTTRNARIHRGMIVQTSFRRNAIAFASQTLTTLILHAFASQLSPP